MISATLDTNILASGARKLGDPSSIPGQVLDRWIEGEFILVCSAPIIEELTRTLNKPYFRRFLTEDQIENVIQMLLDEAVIAELSVDVHGIASHPADDLILSTAVSVGADFLVMGDQALLRLVEYQGVKIVTPREFLSVLERQEPADE